MVAWRARGRWGCSLLGLGGCWFCCVVVVVMVVMVLEEGPLEGRASGGTAECSLGGRYLHLARFRIYISNYFHTACSWSAVCQKPLG